MAEALKNMYNLQYFERLCPHMQTAIPGFNSKDFISGIFNKSWPGMELKERVRHITLVLHNFMPKHFPDACGILISLSQVLKKAGITEQGFQTIFLPDYIQVFGSDYMTESLHAIEEVTKLVSAEYAIRPFIIQNPKQAMKQMQAWSKHQNANVRRLSSEGCRPRLPWAMGIPEFKKDPTSILPILENLKDDPSEYVRRSVANNLNDIGKDHPELVLQIVKKWQGKNADTDWIIKHGCRSLLKKGNNTALILHGFNPESRATIKNLLLPKKRIKIGDVLTFDFNFVNQERTPSNFRLEYSIDYITASGKISRKIFKVTENKFKPDVLIPIARKQSFKDLTTRKHFKGKHVLSILVNGKRMASSDFIVY
jgi:3-methyladenine DNA glycosylase AlkC